MSSESYATAVRGTDYGMSAALGKVGAVFTTEVFTPIQNIGEEIYVHHSAACGVARISVTYFSVPNVKADDLTIEDGRFHAHPVTDRWDGEMREQALTAFADQSVPPAKVEKADGKVAGYGEKELFRGFCSIFKAAPYEPGFRCTLHLFCSIAT